MSLAQGIVDLAEERAAADGFRRVTKVFLRIGALAHVDPRALEFGFDVVSKGSVAAGAELVLERTGAKAYCVACGLSFAVESRGSPCPHCQQHEWLLQQGEELRVSEMEVE